MTIHISNHKFISCLAHTCDIKIGTIFDVWIVLYVPINSSFLLPRIRIKSPRHFVASIRRSINETWHNTCHVVAEKKRMSLLITSDTKWFIVAKEKNLFYWKLWNFRNLMNVINSNIITFSIFAINLCETFYAKCSRARSY